MKPDKKEGEQYESEYVRFQSAVYGMISNKIPVYVPLSYMQQQHPEDGFKNLEELNNCSGDNEEGIPEITMREFEEIVESGLRDMADLYSQYQTAKDSKELKCFKGEDGSVYFKVVGDKRIGFIQ